jgi:hypothetical protein
VEWCRKVQFGGTISYDWRHAGLAAKMIFPIDAIAVDDLWDRPTSPTQCSALLAASNPLVLDPDPIKSNRIEVQILSWCMIFSENRFHFSGSCISAHTPCRACLR